jgi:hypothetical protein
MVSKIVSDLKLEHINDTIIIIKRKVLLQRQLFFSALIIILFAAISWSVLKKSPDAFKKQLDTTDIIFVSCFALIILVYIYLSCRRFLRVVKNFQLEKRHTLLINKKVAFSDSISGPIYVVVQTVSGWKGVGKSFTVGLLKGHKFLGLCYGLGKMHAEDVAQFIAEAFKYEVVHRESAWFPLFKLH